MKKKIDFTMQTIFGLKLLTMGAKISLASVEQVTVRGK